MSTATIVLRLLHVILGALWVGGVGLLVMFIMPAIARTGPTGGQFMQHLVGKTKFGAYMPMLGLITVLSGLGLFWRNSSVSNGAFMKSASGMTYGVGGVAAILAVIIGGAMSGKSAGKMKEIGDQIAASGAPPTPQQSQELGALAVRMRLGARIAFALMLVALVCMAIGRYV